MIFLRLATIYILALLFVFTSVMTSRKKDADSYWLVYASDHLYQVTLDGQYRRPLTLSEQYSFGDLKASHNGEMLAYVAHDVPGFRVSFGGCEPSIFFYDAKFGVRSVLSQPNFCATDTAFSEIQYLSWSPDGEWLVFDYHPSYLTFTANVIVPPRQIHRIRLNATENQALTNEIGDQIQPAWSPDGDWIAYLSQSSVGSQIGYLMRMHPDASQQERLILEEGRYADPTWSPDGKWLYFRTDDDGRFWNIFRLNLASGDIEPVTNMSNNPRQFSFSPNGEKIVFIAGQNDNADVFVMRPDGSEIRQLTNNDVQEASPTWSPDGQWISFTTLTMSSRRIQSTVSIIRPDGTGKRLMATSSYASVWLPMPSLKWHRTMFPILGVCFLLAAIALTRQHRATLPPALRIG